MSIAGAACESQVQEEAARSVSITDAAGRGFAAARRLVLDVAELAALEGRRAALAAVAMLLMGIAAMVLLVAAWLLLMGGLATWIVGAGWSLGAALLWVALPNLLAALALVYLVLRSSRSLLFVATRRALAAEPGYEP